MSSPPDSEDQYFEQLRWEQVDRYAADIIMIDARPSSPPIDEYDSLSFTWTSLPAVEADQLFAWQMYVSTTDYDRYAEQLELMADAVANAEDVV